MRKISGLSLLFVGFMAGVIYIAACDGKRVTSSLAEVLENAVDVLFDSTASGLTAENVQDAIDELDTAVDTLGSQLKTGENLAQILVGLWTGTYCNEGICESTSMTLGSDGSFSCNGNAFGGTCDDPSMTWSVLTRVLQINSSRIRYYYPTYMSASVLEMSDGVQHLYQFTKSE
jgi:hypothetical protein